jgi:hypothetical protein
MRSYAVEVICNREKEPERLQTLQPVLDYFKVEPVCTVWGEEARGHELFKTFRQGTHINGLSLAINHIEVFKRYRDSGCYLVILESDVMPIYPIKDVDSEIEKTIEEMKTHFINFCFIGEGCFGGVNPPNFPSLPSPMKKLTDMLYVGYNSRCTESYIVSPHGIQLFLSFIETFNTTVIDFTFNYFFQHTQTLSAWRFPELFRQGSQCGLYGGNIPNSTL